MERKRDKKNSRLKRNEVSSNGVARKGVSKLNAVALDLRGAVAHDTSLTVRTNDVLLPDGTTFADLLLSERTLEGLHGAGFRRPSPIQLAALPIGRLGVDLIVQAKSGTGKTLVFGIIALEMLDVSIPRPQVLILAPTREIAAQIKEVIKSIATGIKGLKVEVFIGGMSVQKDVVAARNCHVIVGTPGRVKQLVADGHLCLNAVRLFVLDEADRVAEDSFRTDVSYIFSSLPETKQTLVVSATFPLEVKEFLGRFLVSPRLVSPSADTLLLGLRQFAIVTPFHTSPLIKVRNKTSAVLNVLGSLSFRQCLVFCNIQSRMEGICQDLSSRGWPALSLAGSMSQPQRLATVAALQKQRCRVLLSTDLAARGVDAEQVDLVVNLDLPYDTETFLHRIGRAGRFGAPGIAVTIVADGEELQKFQHMLYQIGGSDLSVSLLPNGDISDEDWLPSATLEQIHCQKQEEEEEEEEEEVEESIGPTRKEVLKKLKNLVIKTNPTSAKIPNYKDIVNDLENFTLLDVNDLKNRVASTEEEDVCTKSSEELEKALKCLKLDESYCSSIRSGSSSPIVTKFQSEDESEEEEECWEEEEEEEECWEEEEEECEDAVETDSDIVGDSDSSEWDGSSQSESEDCPTCDGWFNGWRKELELQRIAHQSQLYMKEMLKFE